MMFPRSSAGTADGRTDQEDPAMSKHEIPRVEREVRHADPAARLKAWLVIALCAFTMVAVICGLIYDKSRLS